uniref:Uncharacterized protein n=1 Tax=Brassica oleracea var. oleracea TaxID=109376 RepID=A0A0D3DQV5_BRAOL
MDSYPYNNQNTNFVDLLNSQQDIVFGFGQDNAEVSSSQVPIFGENSTAERKERRTWSPTDDIVLISLWLNTSKDHVVGNEQKSRACIILHYMIVEDERDGYTQYDVSEFQQGEDTGSSHVDLMYSTDIPTNIANMMGVRTRIRDRQMHQQLKVDLVEHIWHKFGRDEDNN